MSEQDFDLVRTTGYPVARIAEILDKSRQTVGRGIKRPDNYFGPQEIIKIISHFEEKNDPLSVPLTTQACKSYPEIADVILSALGKAVSLQDLDEDGEYWFICGDFTAFRTSFLHCFERLLSLSTDQMRHLVVFTNDSEHRSTSRAFRTSRNQNVQIVPCRNIDLRLALPMLLHQDNHRNVALYVASEHGFIHLSEKEAERMRFFIIDNLMPEEDHSS